VNKFLFEVEDAPYKSVQGLYVLVSFKVYKNEIFDTFGSWEYDDVFIDEVQIKRGVWSAFGVQIYEETARPVDTGWENANDAALLQLALDIGEARREEFEEFRASEPRRR
jgi:hypothetical protein